jgi:hypothetical protein
MGDHPLTRKVKAAFRGQVEGGGVVFGGGRVLGFAANFDKKSDVFSVENVGMFYNFVRFGWVAKCFFDANALKYVSSIQQNDLRGKRHGRCSFGMDESRWTAESYGVRHK